MPFPFLDLAPELRVKILLHAIQQPNIINLSQPALSDPETLANLPAESATDERCPYLSLLLTSHQVYHETRPLYWSANTFLLRISRDQNPISYFLDEDFSHHRLLIRTLYLETHRWGSKTFFLDTIIPALQQMILIGNLRRLHVRARKNHVFPGFDSLDLEDLLEFPGEMAIGAEAMQRAMLANISDSSTLPRTFSDPATQQMSLRRKESVVHTEEKEKEIKALRDRLGKWEPVRALIDIMEDPYLEHVKFEVWRIVIEREIVEDVTRILQRRQRGTGKVR